MRLKCTPPPAIARETMLALLAATTAFAAVKPWEYMLDSHVLGLTDPGAGDVRLATVLGNAREVFAAVFYRRAAGLRWLLNMLNAPEKGPDLEGFADIDSLKVELVRKNELRKEEAALLKSLDFKPAGKGPVWPQFQSIQPGWLPWFIDQAEAEQLLLDLPRLTSFAVLFRQHPDLFENRPPAETPFLPNPMPGRPLEAKDLEWRPLVVALETFNPFSATDGQLAQLRALKREPGAVFEYGSRVLFGSSVLEKGRPCRSRVNLLVEHENGLVLGFGLALAVVPFVESAGTGLVEALVKFDMLPGTILLDDPRLQPVLGPLCDALHIDLVLTERLEFLAEAMESLESFMGGGPG